MEVKIKFKKCSFCSKDHFFNIANHKRSRYIRVAQIVLKNRSHLKIPPISSVIYSKLPNVDPQYKVSPHNIKSHR
jgi:hypothetical protein